MAQVRKTYLLGVHNETNVSVNLHTMDLAYVTTYFALRSVKMFISARGFLCGLSIDVLVDGDRKTYKYVAKSAVVLEEALLVLKKGESIRRLVVGYCDQAVTGLDVETEAQRVCIGSTERAEFRAEADYFEARAAVIGFDACFGADRLVELTLFIVPLQGEGGTDKLTKPYLNGSSFALVDEDFYQLMKQQQKDQTVIKSAFDESKHRKLKSL